MRLFKYISILFCLLLVFSCTKSEDDSPQNIVPPSVTDEPFQDFNENIERLDPAPSKIPQPSYINDDGDDESGPSHNVISQK